MAKAGLVLINLENQGVFSFQFFPSSVRSTDRANWTPQETTIGVKPLFYGNREPRSIDVPELWFDSTDTNESLTPTIKKLRALFEETEKGTPPALLATWGDRNERCVLTELSIEETFFNTQGHPIRARIQISLMQVQSDVGATTGVRILE